MTADLTELRDIGMTSKHTIRPVYISKGPGLKDRLNWDGKPPWIQMVFSNVPETQRRSEFLYIYSVRAVLLLPFLLDIRLLVCQALNLNSQYLNIELLGFWPQTHVFYPLLLRLLHKQCLVPPDSLTADNHCGNIQVLKVWTHLINHISGLCRHSTSSASPENPIIECSGMLFCFCFWVYEVGFALRFPHFLPPHSTILRNWGSSLLEFVNTLLFKLSFFFFLFNKLLRIWLLLLSGEILIYTDCPSNNLG